MENVQSNPDFFELYKRASNALGVSDYSSRIIHYTSTEVLKNILRGNSLWFGAISQMNDTAECDHFLEHVLKNSSMLLGDVDPTGLEQIIAQISPAIRHQTFISSWCEYFDAEPNGKLSMWREYAEDATGLGLVVDSSQMQPSSLTAKNVGFHLYSTKVQYVRDNRVVAHANDSLRRIASLPEHEGALTNKIQLAALILGKAPCVKHDGFAEEEEVRFLYMKGLQELFGAPGDAHFIKTLETPDGTKSFYEFPLENYPAFDFDFRISSILKKVIVGPAKGKEDRAAEVRQILNAFNLHHIPVDLCQIPLR